MAAALRLVIGFSPGSASDEVARTFAPALERLLGRAVSIVLRPGNNGADAAREVAAAKPDGATFFMATLGTHALAPHLARDLPYDPLRDFSAVTLVSTAPLVLACHASLGVSDTRALVDLARARPGELTYGTSAVGGAPHLAAELFQDLAGVEMKHVRYAHTTRLYDDLQAGRIALSFNNMMSMLPRCGDGTLRALAVTTSTRSPSAVALPTLAESGLTGYDLSNWLGVVAPAGTQQSVIDETQAAIAAALTDAAVQAALRRGGVTPRGSTPHEFADFMAHEHARWGPVVARFRDAHADAVPTT